MKALSSKVLAWIAVFALVMQVLIPSAGVMGGTLQAPLYSLVSPFASTPPVIDGKLDSNEWNLSSKQAFPHGFISVMNDAFRLYVLIDVTGDSTDDPGDYFWLAFDRNNNGIADGPAGSNYSTADIMYGLDSNGNLRYQYFQSSSSWSFLQPTTYSSRGKGFGCFLGDGSLSYSNVKPFSKSCSSHRVWELAIDLAEIKASAGGTVRMGVRVNSGSPYFQDEIPSPITTFSNLITIGLAPNSTMFMAPLEGATAALMSNAIEITQAVQTLTNSLPLVAGKTTVARVYARTANVPAPEYVRTYLYASKSGIDLPGSPMAVLKLAPTAPNRNNLNDTANFLLPKSWTEGTIQFHAGVADFIGPHSAASTPFNLTFTAKLKPVYWIVPLNIGSAAYPQLVSDTEIATQESYLKAIYPVPDVTFVHKPWTDLGPVTISASISTLNTYYSSVALAWAQTVLMGETPFALPAQIFGFAPSGGGISDPTWVGASGWVARGYRGTSGDGTMAHEINHNLDRAASGAGTWGRHASDPGGGDNPDWGCGAAGPDPNWPFGDDSTHEIGFDTRLPWSASGTNHTVVPNDFPDLMSYCKSGEKPTKWISAYRWTNLFDFFPNAPPPINRITPNVLYISGWLKQDGTGKLNPVLRGPGFEVLGSKEGAYSIGFTSPIGAASYQPLTFINPVFIEEEEKLMPAVHFNFIIPDRFGTSSPPSLQLRHGSEVLDEIVIPATTPTVTITQPAGGENWTGLQTVSWIASNAISFTVLYSPDGSAWEPVASNLSANQVVVDTSALTPSTAGRFRVIASDGFKNAQDDSEVLTIGVQPPHPIILSPVEGSQIPTGITTILEGSVTDLIYADLPDENFIWMEGSQVIGTGRSQTINLVPGDHTIELVVENGDGLSGSAFVQLFVGSKIYVPAVLK